LHWPTTTLPLSQWGLVLQLAQLKTQALPFQLRPMVHSQAPFWQTRPPVQAVMVVVVHMPVAGSQRPTITLALLASQRGLVSQPEQVGRSPGAASAAGGGISG
jgi:hypothetical protein